MVGGDNKGVLLEGNLTFRKQLDHYTSLRGKVPIHNQENEIIGVVSVGFSMDDIHGAVEVYGKRVFWITIIGLLIGVIGSIYLAGSIKRMMFGMEPEEISSLYEEHSTVIQSVREGLLSLINMA